MRVVLAHVRRWAGAPQVFALTALVATALLVVLESQTPWDITYTPTSGNGFIVESNVRPVWAVLGSILLVGAPLAALRSVLLGVLLVLPRLIMGLAIGFAWPWTAYAAFMSVAVCASWRRPRVARFVAAVAVAQPIAVIANRGRMMTPGGSVELGLQGAGTSGLILTGVFYVVATVLVMLLTILLRREAARERDLFELVRGRREVASNAAVLGERARLARDLHDVVAHHVSLIAVRAETAPYTYPDLSAEARDVLAEIADEARKALDELRGVLGILRRSDGDSQLAPQPTAVSIGRLVLDAQAATDVVSGSLQGLEAVQPTPGYVAYRVVQEALTNARRHAPGAAVDVTAHGDGAGGIRVLVSNRAPRDAGLERGRGLAGMAERVDAAGGHLEIELRDGDFVVEARLPAVSRPRHHEQEDPQ